MKNILSLFLGLAVLALSVCGADAPPDKSADELWQSIQKAEEAPLPHGRAQYAEQLNNLRGLVLGFENRFPGDPRRWDAKLVRMQIDGTLAQADNRKPDSAPLLQLTKEIVASVDAAPETKSEARYLAAATWMETLEASGSVTNSAARTAVDATVEELRRLYPEDQRTAMIQFELARILKTGDPAAAESILQNLGRSKNPQVAAVAQNQLATMKTLQKVAKEPLDLKFKAVDGTDVDLAKLRGKVVLVDFWATWCGPCRREIPNVVATYNQLHKSGFEIIGISLDQDKAQMLAFTKQAGMTWPQYFDGKTWRNDISSRFGIEAIPAAWLVDKKGLVRSTEAHGDDLTAQVKTLLAE